MSIFDTVLTGFCEIRKKNLNNHDFLDENADFGRFGPFLACLWPVFGLSWPQNKCSKLIMSIFVLDLTGMSEITKKKSK